MWPYSSFEKSIITERKCNMSRREFEEGFDDYFYAQKKEKENCKLKHVKNWLKLFVIDYYNKEI